MILYSQALVASAPTPLTHPRILYKSITHALSPTDITVSTETAEGPRDATTRPDTAEYWLASALPATIEYSFSAAKNMDAFGLAAHQLGSKGNTLLVETKLGGAGYSTFAAGIAPTTDAPILLLDESRSIDKLRLTISGGSGAPRIAVVYADVALAMQRALYGGHTPLNLSRETVLKRALSRGGQFLGQTFRRNGVAGTASFSNLKAAWVRSDFDPFIVSARNTPFFFAWRPLTYMNEIAYVWALDDIAPSNMGKKDFMQVSWKMYGVSNG